MAVTSQQFKDLATKLLTDTFSDLRIDCTFELPGAYDPVSGTTQPGVSEVISCIREDYEAGQIDGQLIQRNDFKLLALPGDFSTTDVKTDELKVTVDGKVCTVKNAMLDPAGALWVLQVRG